MLLNLMLIAIFWDKHHYNPIFTDEEIEAQSCREMCSSLHTRVVKPEYEAS